MAHAALSTKEINVRKEFTEYLIPKQDMPRLTDAVLDLGVAESHSPLRTHYVAMILITAWALDTVRVRIHYC